MKDDDRSLERSRRTSHAQGHSIQVICLGSGGGPSEDNVTGFLVRSIASNWSKGSVLAVDAGSHLAAVTRILQTDFPNVSEAPQEVESPGNDDIDTPTNDHPNDSSFSPNPFKVPTMLNSGPFAGLPFPYASARANALHVVREHVSTYLITHPHLDHVSGFVINTAAFHNTSRPKRLAALPFTVNAIKTHLFNDIIWPNLTDEDGGVGFVTFQRLAEGGNIALGEGPTRGFIEVCNGLSAKGFKVSHGHCMRGSSHVHRGSAANLQENSSGLHSNIAQTPSRTTTGLSTTDPSVFQARTPSFDLPSQPGTPLFPASKTENTNNSACVIDSTAYFIRADAEYSATQSSPAREILIFGDVEPDSLSLSPRTLKVWTEAAPKIAGGILTGIFIECSYNNSQADQVLFGHVSPRHLIAELQTLAELVGDAKREREEARKGRKRKRASAGFLSLSDGMRTPLQDESNKSRRESRTTQSSHISGSVDDDTMTDLTSPRSLVPNIIPPTAASERDKESLGLTQRQSFTPDIPEHRTTASSDTEGPLKGVQIVIIHVKDTLTDGPLVGESILAQLQEHEVALQQEGRGLGCEFHISRGGQSYFF